MVPNAFTAVTAAERFDDLESGKRVRQPAVRTFRTTDQLASDFDTRWGLVADSDDVDQRFQSDGNCDSGLMAISIPGSHRF